MKVTILYDNESRQRDLKADWGFSCIVEKEGRKILFDTGANGRILLNNMRGLGVSPESVDEIFISHDHWDHTGGFSEFTKERDGKIKVYIPSSCSSISGAGEIIRIDNFFEIHDKIYSTGELQNIEQSMAVKTEEGTVVITGCSHPGVQEILHAVRPLGKVKALVGGLHGFSQFELLKNLDLVCATHCTQYKAEIESSFPDKFIQGGAGTVIEL
ncbi:MAG: MBL fold metallo-hydrolase [Syntrophales bacterium]|nr:MBL fold metallo-hydrolase [Syntrophales bacterium]MDY0045276.1 MBL fold metallo-hydrolase [Syntrophales bacterium]